MNIADKTIININFNNSFIVNHFFVMLMLFLLTYFAVMGMQLLDSLGSMV